MSDDAAEAGSGGPHHHRTVDRMTQILEEVVYHPGIGFAEIARALDAPKGSVHGFIRGLLAKGWLHETNRSFYVGPAFYGLTLASGDIRAGQVTQQDLDDLHAATGMTVFLGVQAGDNLIYIGESGTDATTGYLARTNIRRKLISTAGGRALLAAMADSEREAYLRRLSAEDRADVSQFLADFAEIKASGVARHQRYHGEQVAMAGVLCDEAGHRVATAIIVGRTAEVEPRRETLDRLLLEHIAAWRRRRRTAREPI